MASLAWLIPFIPLLGFIINGLGFRKISKNLAGIIRLFNGWHFFFNCCIAFRAVANGKFFFRKIDLYQ